jgi:hypothetical protein
MRKAPIAGPFGDASIEQANDPLAVLLHERKRLVAGRIGALDRVQRHLGELHGGRVGVLGIDHDLGDLDVLERGEPLGGDLGVLHLARERDLVIGREARVGDVLERGLGVVVRVGLHHAHGSGLRRVRHATAEH